MNEEEDEKLLHLAKLISAVETIAPVVGRTPSQCLTRYEKLLDAACAKDGKYDAADDPKVETGRSTDPEVKRRSR